MKRGQSSPANEGEPDDDSSSNISRVSKACDPCRARKVRCDIATQAICSECVRRNQAEQCTLREKARPNRTTAKKSDTRDPARHVTVSATLNRQDAADETYTAPSPPFPHVARLGSFRTTKVSLGESRAKPVSAAVSVESMLEAEASRLFGLSLSVSPQPENVFPARQSQLPSLEEIGLIPGLPDSLSRAKFWINTHFHALHHNTPFLHLPQLVDSATKLYGPNHQTSSDEVDPSDRALLYAVLALGSLREQTFDVSTGRYKAIPTASSTTTTPDALAWTMASHSESAASDDRPFRASQTLFHAANQELDAVEQPSETSVQALFLLHTYVSNTSMSRRSRDYIARAVMMAHEIGLNQRVPTKLDAIASAKRPRYDTYYMRRRAILYLYVCFSDVYLSALEGHPPLIKRQDYDMTIFDYIDQASSSGMDTPSNTPLTGFRAFTELVTTVGEILEQLHVGYFGALPKTETPVDLVLRLEMTMDSLRERLGAHTFGPEGAHLSIEKIRQTANAGALIRQIHYNWSRIALRAPFLRDPMLRHSSLAICARSALTILHIHRHVINAGLLNLPWMQLRRVAISVFIAFLALWRGEITASEGHAAVQDTLHVLAVFQTRWKSAYKTQETVVLLAERSGLSPVLPEPMDLTEQGVPQAATMAVPNAPHLDLEWMTEGLPEEDARDIIQQILDIDSNGARGTLGPSAADGAFADLMMSWQEQQDPAVT